MAFVVIGIPAPAQIIDATDFAHAAGVRAPAPDAIRMLDSDGVPRPLRIYVVGDSTGLTFVDGLDMWGNITGDLAVTNGSVTGCGLLDGAQLGFPKTHSWLPEEVVKECDRWPTRWRHDIAPRSQTSCSS